MKKLMFIFSLLLVTVVAQAQFEKGKWFVNPSVTGLNLSYNTQTEKLILVLKPMEVLSW